MNASLESQLQSNPRSSNTPSALDAVTLAWASGTPSSNTETNSTLKYAPRNYPHTPEQIAKELKIDEEGKLYWARKGGNGRRMYSSIGTNDSNGYLQINLDLHSYKVHILAFCLYYGRWPATDKVIDHINGDKQDNRKINLREISRTSNGQNRKGANSNNKYGVRGVTWRKASRKWEVVLIANHKRIYGGMYIDFNVAVAVRKQLEVNYAIAGGADNLCSNSLALDDSLKL